MDTPCLITVYITPPDCVGTVIIGVSDTVIIGPDFPGPPGVAGADGGDGPQGPPGESGGASFTRTAAQPLSGHRVVKTVGGNRVDYASNDQIADAVLIEGITFGAADADADIVVQGGGDMIEGSWSWSLGPIFCGLNGQLTQTPPPGAWIRQVAVAVDTDRIIVGLSSPTITP